MAVGTYVTRSHLGISIWKRTKWEGRSERPFV